MKQLKLILSTVLAMLISTSVFAASNVTASDWGVLLNLSGKQRMLTQKMTKDAVQIYLNQEKASSIASLEASSALFDKTLTGLKNGDSSLSLVAVDSDRLKRQLSKVDEAWQPFKKSINDILTQAKSGGDLDKSKLEYLVNNNLKLLKESNRAVRLYEKLAKDSGLSSDPNMATTINLAGKQRMLSQKMSKDFLLVQLGMQKDAAQADLKLTVNLFDRTLNGLEKGDETLGLKGTDISAANAQLKKVNEIWVKFKPIFNKAAVGEKSSPDDINYVVNNSTTLLKEMNAAVKIYEQSVK